MNEDLLEIRNYEGSGYKPLIDYGAWRVAILRWAQSMLAEKMESMERHIQTDEVFILLHGQATLILGGNGYSPEGISPHVMQPEKLYNVKRNTWHSILLSRDASILIVENQDTSEGNTEYAPISPEMKQEINRLNKK